MSYTLKDLHTSKIGLYGGTFDPIHKGHIEVIKASLRHVDQLILIPTFCNPFKLEKPSHPIHRINMLNMALSNHPEFKARVIIDTTECFGAQTVYSFMNIQRWRNISKNLYLVIGTDCWNEIEKWKNFNYIRENVKFIVINRDNNSINNKFNCITQYIPPLFISSSHYRKNHDPSLLEENINKYIQENSLYIIK